MSESQAAGSAPGQAPVVFLVSQPRAGSTLLQKLLAGHSEIATASEPWIMLHASTVFRPGAISADYDAELAAMGLDSFLEALPHGRQTYFEGMRMMYGYLYDQARQSSGGRIFLDKTPRYYLIIPQLLEIFPRSKIVILLREPLAVLVSMIRSWKGVKPSALRENRLDLFAAPGLLESGMQGIAGNIVKVRYEKLLEEPERTLRGLCESLELDFEPAMLNFNTSFRKRWLMGDQDKIYDSSGLDVKNADRWKECLSDPSIWRLCNDYLIWLGESLYTSLGYSWEEANTLLRQNRPGVLRRTYTLSLRQVTGRESESGSDLKIPLIRKAWNRVLGTVFPGRAPQ